MEIMVVLIIIAILAAVAVANYQKTVYRSRFSQLEASMRPLYESMMRYIADQGTYPSSLEDLDVQIGEMVHPCVFGSVTTNRQCARSGNYYYYLSNSPTFPYATSIIGLYLPEGLGKGKIPQFGYIMSPPKSTWNPNLDGTVARLCIPFKNNLLSIWLCDFVGTGESYGGSIADSKSFIIMP